MCSYYSTGIHYPIWSPPGKVTIKTVIMSFNHVRKTQPRLIIISFFMSVKLRIPSLLLSWIFLQKILFYLSLHSYSYSAAGLIDQFDFILLIIRFYFDSFAL